MEQPLTPISKPGTRTLTLNPQQQTAKETILNYLEGDAAFRMWLMKGYAGTGKTTTMMQIIRDYLFDNPDAKIAVSAPTHKAVSVLRKQQSLGERVHYATIHSLLGLKESINQYTGKISFVPAFGENGPRLTEFDVLILDEVSMLQTLPEKVHAQNSDDVDLFELLTGIAAMYHIKIVMMGDPVQIPPVNAPDPTPFLKEGVAKFNIGVMELTQIMRQSGDSPILDYATELRRVYKTGNVVPRTILTRDEGILVIHNSEEEKIREVLQRLFTSEQFKDDPDYAKVIAWRNVTVDLYNREIRKMIYGQDVLPMVMPMERMICDAPVIQVNQATGREEIVLYTNEEVLVTESTISHKLLQFAQPFMVDSQPEHVRFKYYKTRVEKEVMDNEGNVKTVSLTLDIMHEDSLELFNSSMKEHVRITKNTSDSKVRGRLWKQYYDNQRKFAWMKYNYAITAHKSQGSTYANVVMLHWDIDRNQKVEERNRIKYVAATRPRHNLYIIT
jgi:hypothetical protein